MIVDEEPLFRGQPEEGSNPPFAEQESALRLTAQHLSRLPGCHERAAKRRTAVKFEVDVTR